MNVLCLLKIYSIAELLGRGTKLHKEALEEVNLSIEKSVELLVEKVPFPVKAISFDLVVDSLSKGLVVRSKIEKGSYVISLE